MTTTSMPAMGMMYRSSSSALFTASFDGTRWSGDTAISSQPGDIVPESSHNPGICLFNNRLWAVYTAENEDLFVCWYDGQSWAGDNRIGSMEGDISPKSGDRPSLVVYDNMLTAVYSGGTNNLFLAFFDGTQWYGDQMMADDAVHPQTAQGVHAVVFGGALFLVYKRPGSSDLYTAWLDSNGLHGDKKIKDQPGGIAPQSDRNPAAVVFKGRLYIFYISSSKRLFTAWFDGTTWHDNVPIADQPGELDPRSSDSPGVVVFQNHLYLVYKGDTTDDLYSAWWDGTTWYGGKKISEQPGGISPKCGTNPELCFMPVPPTQLGDWMEGLSASLPICDINLPGTHDSAAINSLTTTFYACHYDSITQQLEAGVRLLDIRLEISQSGSTFTFMTCHGNWNLYVDLNVYQSLTSVLDECTAFLGSQHGEFVAMILKDEVWKGEVDKNAALSDLAGLLARYPVWTGTEMPTLGQVRGKIYLMNRINQDLRLGVPVSWEFNTSGSWAYASANRTFPVYVQDQFQDFSTFGSTSEKLALFTAALDQAQPGQVLLNFASATYYGVAGVYIMAPLLDWFGDSSAEVRTERLGWSLFDYSTTSYQTNNYAFMNCLRLIVDSNFGYKFYPGWFSVIGDGKDEL